jgi:polyvinyl alcohol dehydrogenase (cytochrome)
MKSMTKVLILAIIAGLTLHSQPAAPAARPPQGEGAGSTIFGNACLGCHDRHPAIPTYAQMRPMTSERILASEDSVAAHRAAKEVTDLTEQQKRDIAEWISERRLSVGKEDAADLPNKCALNPPITAAQASSLPSWNGWSPNITNTRFQPAKAADLTPAEVQRLQLKWAFAFPSGVSMYGQPTILANHIFVGADNGYIYSLDARTGCVYWSFRAQAGVSGAISIEPKPGSPNNFVAYFGDTLSNVYSLNASNGELNWKAHTDDHPLARIRAAVRYLNGRLYVPVASLEEPDSSSYNHMCCSFRGSVVALDAVTGKQIWKTYTIDEKPTPRAAPDGAKYVGPGGAGVWGTLAMDPKRKSIYLGTGNAFSEPDTGRSDAIISLNMDTGKINWVKQDEPGDVWHTGCPQGPPLPGLGLPPKSARNTAQAPARGGQAAAAAQPARPASHPPGYYCPTTTNDPDWDFSAGPMLVDMPSAKSLVVAGQKSGMVWAHDADTGELVWKSDISRGGSTFGGATDGESAYFAMQGGTVSAIRLTDGLEKWATKITPQESMSGHPGFSAAISLIPGVLFVPGKDGVLNALSSFDGRILWTYDTTQEVKTVNGITARGGSIGSAGATIAGGMVFVPSGYTGFQGGQKGNIILAFGPPVN